MNLPNKLSILRIILIPFFMFFYLATFIPYARLFALILLVAAELTDFFDGYIARKYNMVTDLGKLLDPVADKSFSLTAMILLTVDFVIPNPYGVIILVIFLLRDFIVSGLRQIAASKNVVIAADKWGKIKSIILDISLPVLFFVSYVRLEVTPILNSFMTGIYAFGLTLLAISTILTVYSGINYLIKNKQVLKWM